jgi:hypothetical protein
VVGRAVDECDDGYAYLVLVRAASLSARCTVANQAEHKAVKLSPSTGVCNRQTNRHRAPSERVGGWGYRVPATPTRRWCSSVYVQLARQQVLGIDTPADAPGANEASLQHTTLQT